MCIRDLLILFCRIFVLLETNLLMFQGDLHLYISIRYASFFPLPFQLFSWLNVVILLSSIFSGIHLRGLNVLIQEFKDTEVN